MADVQFISNSKMQAEDGPVNDRFNKRSRSRSPMRRSSRSRSRSPRDWKRTERSDRDRERDRPRRDSSRSGQVRGSERPAGPVNSKRLFISNIPYQLRWQDLKDLFRDKVGEVTYVELYENPEGKSLGAGIIEFKDKETAQKAVDSMHQYEIEGRRIIVREERDRDRRRLEAQRGGDHGDMGGDMGGGGGSGLMGSGNMMGGGSGGRGGGGGMMGGNTSASTLDMIGSSGNMNQGIMGAASDLGVPAQLLQQLGIDGPISNQVFVANLDYKVTWKKLKDVFSLAGNVITAEIKEDRDGKSRGLGTVLFESPLEAVQAISMFNGQVLYERTMSVRIDKMADSTPAVPAKLPSGLRTIGMGLGVGGAPVKNFNQGSSGMSGNLGSGMNMGGGMGGGLMGSGLGGNMGNMGTGLAGNMGNMVGGNMGMGGNMGGNMGGGMGGGMGGNFNEMGIASGNMGGGLSGGMSGGLNTGMAGGGFGNNASSMGGGMGMNNLNQMGNMGGGMGDMNLGGRGLQGNQRGLDVNNMGGMGAIGSGVMGGNMGNNMGGGMSSMSSNRMNYGSSGNMGSSSRNMGNSRMGGSGMDENTSVYVKNLPYTYNWKDLKDRFGGVGDVKYAAIKMENGKSKGVGIVRFGSSEEARRAVQLMHGARIDGREIEVRLER